MSLHEWICIIVEEISLCYCCCNKANHHKTQITRFRHFKVVLMLRKRNIIIFTMVLLKSQNKDIMYFTLYYYYYYYCFIASPTYAILTVSLWSQIWKGSLTWTKTSHPIHRFFIGPGKQNECVLLSWNSQNFSHFDGSKSWTTQI